MTGSRLSAAVLVCNGFQEMEFWYPVLRFREEGVDVTVIGCDGDGAHVSKLGYPVVPNVALGDASPNDYDAILVPSGGSSMHLAADSRLVGFFRRVNGSAPIFGASGEGIAALASAMLINGARVAAPEGCASGVEVAGAILEPAGVAVDGRIVSCRTPDDLPEYFASILKLLHQSK